MHHLIHRTKAFLASEDGPTASEYAIMLALIILAAIAGVMLLGRKDSQVFTDVSQNLPSS